MIPSGRGSGRTVDKIIDIRRHDGSVVRARYEDTTITGAGRGYRPRGAADEGWQKPTGSRRPSREGDLPEPIGCTDGGPSASGGTLQSISRVRALEARRMSPTRWPRPTWVPHFATLAARPSSSTCRVNRACGAKCFGTCASRMALLSSCPRPHRDYNSRAATFATWPGRNVLAAQSRQEIPEAAASCSSSRSMPTPTRRWRWPPMSSIRTWKMSGESAKKAAARCTRPNCPASETDH